jgi:hypothetical protein
MPQIMLSKNMAQQLRKETNKKGFYNHRTYNLRRVIYQANDIKNFPEKKILQKLA